MPPTSSLSLGERMTVGFVRPTKVGNFTDVPAFVYAIVPVAVKVSTHPSSSHVSLSELTHFRFLLSMAIENMTFGSKPCFSVIVRTDSSGLMAFTNLTHQPFSFASLSKLIYLCFLRSIVVGNMTLASESFFSVIC